MVCQILRGQDIDVALTSVIGLALSGRLVYQHILYCSLIDPPSNSPQCFVPNLWSLSNTPAPGSSFKRNNLTTWFTQKTKGRQYKNPWFLFSSPQNHSPSASLCPHFRGRDISLSCQDSFILILSLYPTTPYSLRYD